jgi:hypothetical protein
LVELVVEGGKEARRNRGKFRGCTVPVRKCQSYKEALYRRRVTGYDMHDDMLGCCPYSEPRAAIDPLAPNLFCDNVQVLSSAQELEREQKEYQPSESSQK